jgi:hypothetical protein
MVSGTMRHDSIRWHKIALQRKAAGRRVNGPGPAHNEALLLMDASSSHRPPAAITVRSHFGHIDLTTPLPDEDAWLMLLVPNGSTDQQVLAWAEQTLPPAAVDELRERIEREARP